MNVSPYIEESLQNPAAKIFSTPEDIMFDTKLSFQEKKLLLKCIHGAEHGLIHVKRI